MKNLIIRATTGLFFIALILGAIVYKSYSFMALFTLITFLSLFEFYQLIRGKENIFSNIFDSLGGAILFMALFSSMGGNLFFSPATAFSLYFVYILILFISRIYSKRELLKSWGYAILGQAYIALPFSLLNVIAFQPDFTGRQIYSSVMLLAFFIFIWANDTGAYLIGTWIGKHKLYPRISPKKSWEGFWGGIFFSLIVAFLFGHFYSQLFSYIEWMGLALTISIFGTWGDLCESAIKRQLDIKDSGGMFPGHGGMLDRFDSTFIAAPAAMIYLTLIF